jgi:DNA polymerase III subunit alpha
MIIFDTETTGLIKNGFVELKDQPEIVEFAAIKLDDKTLEEVGRLEFLIRPTKPITDELVKIHGITNEMVADAGMFPDHFPKLVEFFFGERYSVAHNHSYDAGMLSLELRRMKREYKFPWTPVQICTVGSTFHIKNYRLNLTALHNHLFGIGFAEAHRAMGDVEALTKCTIKLIKDGVIKL